MYQLLQGVDVEETALQNIINQIIELDEIRRKSYDQNFRSQEKTKKTFDNQLDKGTSK